MFSVQDPICAVYEICRICTICKPFFVLHILVQCVYLTYSAYLVTEQGTVGHTASAEIQHHVGAHWPVYNPADWPRKTSWSDAHFLLADDTKEIAADQPPGLGVHPPTWNLRRRFSAPNR